MILLDTIYSILELKLANSVASLQFPIVVNYKDGVALGSQNSFSNNTNIVSIVSAPITVNRQREIGNISIRNVDSSPNTVIIQRSNDGIKYVIMVVQLSIGDTLYYETSRGWYVIDATGAVKGIGATGSNGMTAYEIAVLHGYVGTDVDWLASLKGKGFTGGSYNAGTGIVTFASSDGLGFSTTDLRGAAGAVYTFSTGLTNTSGTITVNTIQNIIRLSNLTTNGIIRTSASNGTLIIDTNTYLTSNQNISLTGDVTGTGTTSITTTLANTAVTPGSYTNANISIDSKGRIVLASNGTSGTVSSVSGVGTVNGLTLTGTVTTTGNLTLGGTLSGISLSSQVAGTLPVANGGSGTTSLTGYLKGNGTSAFTASATIPYADVTGGPTIPTVGDGTLTLATSGVATGSASFTANQSGNTTFTVAVPITLSSYTNDVGFVTSSGVTSVTGTLNRIISSGGTSPAIDIASTYIGQSSITTLGTISTGIWNGTSIADSYISSATTWNSKQNAISLTTTGTSGIATFSGGILNIPNYAGSYTLPTASTSVLGGVKIDGTTITISGGGIISSTGGISTPYAEIPSGLLNGSNTVFTVVNTPASSSGLICVLDGVIQYNGIDFTVSGNTITFATAPASTTDSIFVYYNTFSGGGGSVTSVSGTGSVNGITLTGTVTSSGNLTLGGTLSGISLTSQVTGLLPDGNISSASTWNGKQNALGFTPYNSTNPSGYTSNVGDVTLTGTQTLTNKTLTSPKISSISNTGTITIPTTTGTLALVSQITGINSNTNTGDNAVNTLYSGLASSKQDVISLTTTGTSGASTLIGSTLNIPQYAGSYSLPTASTSILGGVKVDGTTITISGGGVISAVAGGAGTVTSVGLTTPTGLTTTGSPISTSGTLAVTYTAGYQGYTTVEATKLSGIATGATANTGTVTAIGVTSANGISGTSSGGATPNLTLSLGAITPTSVAASGTVTGSNLSNSNTGDNSANTLYSGLAASKQDTLVSATNIKTINGTTLLGSGDISVGGADPTKLPLAGGTMTGGIVLVAGTTTLQPLKMVSGTNLITPVAGVFEFDGTNLYFSV